MMLQLIANRSHLIEYHGRLYKFRAEYYDWFEVDQPLVITD